MPQKIMQANPAGFCGGVQQAVAKTKNILREARHKRQSVFCNHVLVHNHLVNEELFRQGLQIISLQAPLPPKAIFIISTHGAPQETYELIINQGGTIIDTTCPQVKHVQNRAQKLGADGYQVIILGELEHQEVQGILSHCHGAATVIPAASKMPIFAKHQPLAILAQTTQQPSALAALANEIKKTHPNCHVENTICQATQARQTAARQVASRVDLMLVIGDRKSANTKRLFEICQEIVTTYWLQTTDDLPPKAIQKAKIIGITAGASTPNSLIEEIKQLIHSIDT